jgi:hypothetical protein
MQNRPDKAALLEAVARFLEKDIKPSVKDPSLSFRLLVAANLCRLVSAEIQMEDVATDAEIERLQRLLPDVEVDVAKARESREGRVRAIARYNRALCDRIASGALSIEPSGEVWSHVSTTLRGELLTSSPRYDTSLDIE